MNDSIKKNILAQNQQLNDLSCLLESYDSLNQANDEEISSLKRRNREIRERFAKAGVVIPDADAKNAECDESTIVPEVINADYEYVTKQNIEYLSQRGLLDREFDSLFSGDDLKRIERELSKPIQREKWDKWDFVAVLSGGIVGVVADLLSSDTAAFMIDNLSKIDTLQEWCKQTQKLSIDYQGPGFGGRYHRGMSSGHDILRPFKAISQIKKGEFVGLKQTREGFEWIKTTTTRDGNAFAPPPHTDMEAFILWVKHICSDLKDPTGMPFPGMSFLVEMPNHDVRKFAIQLYTHGYTLQFIIAQALAPALVELIVRGYVFGREFKDSGEIKFPSAKRLKTTELLLTSHALVTAINAGKVVIQCNAEGPLALRHLNIPSIIMTVRYFIPFVIKRMQLNDPVEILKRNAAEINQGYDYLIAQFNRDLERDVQFKRFLQEGNQIIL
jgi:hypothetical protein